MHFAETGPCDPVNIGLERRGSMRQHWTSEQIRALVVNAEKQLEQAITTSLLQDPLHETVLDDVRGEVHDAIVSLITLFRDHAAGTTDVASLIAREYAKCSHGTTCNGISDESAARHLHRVFEYTVDIAPTPGLSRLIGADHRMPGSVEMTGRVLVF
jgi:hypothetical protein